MVMGYSKNQKGAKDFLRWVHSKRFTISGSPRSRASPSGRPPSGRTTHCGRMIRLCCRSARSRRSGGLRAMPGRPTGRRPRS
jgi:hypothetical protein